MPSPLPALNLIATPGRRHATLDLGRQVCVAPAEVVLAFGAGSLSSRMPHALTLACPQSDRDPGTAACHARSGARNRAARLSPDPGIELLRQYGAMHRPRPGDRADFFRDRDRADLFTNRRGVRA